MAIFSRVSGIRRPPPTIIVTFELNRLVAEGVGSEPFLPSHDQGDKGGFATLRFKRRNAAKSADRCAFSTESKQRRIRAETERQ